VALLIGSSIAASLWLPATRSREEA
jgi:hypothetical protein